MVTKICIIILDYNNSKDTISAYESISKSVNNIIKHRYDIDVRFFVVDNGSKQDNKEKNMSYFSKQKFTILINKQELFSDIGKDIFISIPSNLGFTGGNNLGFKFALNNKFHYIWLLNNDINIEQETLPVFLDFIIKNPKPSILGSVIMDYRNREQVQSFGTYRIGWKGYSQVPLSEKNKEVINVDAVSGCSMFIPTSIIKDIGFFDENLFLYVEETELSYRAKIKGYKSFTLTNSKVYHKGSQSLGKLSKLKKYYTIRNLFLFKKKHFSKFNLYSNILFQLLIHIPKFKLSRSKWYVFFIAVYDALVNNQGICKRKF